MTTGKRAFILVGLGYGDEAKGAWTDFLARNENVHTVIRFNGGAQAGHNVVAPDGTHHTFHQFGSATFVRGVGTYLSQYMLVNPIALMREANELGYLGVPNPLARVTVDDRALVTTPFHVSMNRLREMARGKGNHGSCGMGIGETMSYALDHSDVLNVADIRNEAALRVKLKRLRDYMVEQARGLVKPAGAHPSWDSELALIEDAMMVNQITESYRNFTDNVRVTDGSFLRELLSYGGDVVFEGAQGVLLDEWKGFHPYTTWSTTTSDNAQAILRDNDYSGETIRVGLLRAYMTRHGAGPFVTESKLVGEFPADPYNPTNAWQQGFRSGPIDFVALRYALEATGGADILALSHLDHYVAGHEPRQARRVCVAYRFLGGPDVRDIFEGHGDGVAEFKDGWGISEPEVRRLLLSKEPQNLEHQEGLTDFMRFVEPAYDLAKATPESLIEHVERELGVPVRLIASGPAATDRQWVGGSVAVSGAVSATSKEANEEAIASS